VFTRIEVVPVRLPRLLDLLHLAVVLGLLLDLVFVGDVDLVVQRLDLAVLEKLPHRLTIGCYVFVSSVG
jgi:hypothetical protein